MVSNNITISNLKTGFSDLSGDNTQEDFIKANITDHLIKKEDNFPYSEYVVYRLDMNNSIKTWSCWKRYSEFKDLRDAISKNNYILNLPTFPEKKILNNKSRETIQNRKYHLSNFINFLLGKMKIQPIKEVLDFIEIDNHTLNLIFHKSKLDTNISSTYNCKLLSSTEGKKSSTLELSKKIDIDNYYSQFLDYKSMENSSKTTNMQVIEEFLMNLEEKFQSKTTIIKTFETFLKSKKTWPQFKSEEIFRLFFGDFDKDNNLYRIHGILFHVGAIDNNLLGAEECLLFLVKLLQCEFNPEYEKYISVMKTMKREHLEFMQLATHLKINKTKIKHAVYKLVDYLYEKNNQKLDQILDECGLLVPYKQYIESEEIINNLDY